MANIMRTKLGSWLVVAPLDSESVILPSPDELQFKILIKSKVLPPDATSQEFSTDTESESDRGNTSSANEVNVAKSNQLNSVYVFSLSNHWI